MEQKRKYTENPPGNGGETQTLLFRKFRLHGLHLQNTQAANKMENNGRNNSFFFDKNFTTPLLKYNNNNN